MLWILQFLPRKWLSRVTGILMHFRYPPPLSGISIRAFASLYGINTREAEKNLGEYRSIGEFFSRKLKPGSRPIATSWAVHPSDSRILQHGPIENGTLIQAKGRKFKLLQLTEDPGCAEKYGDGLFITYYLCPTDYHRVHSPITGFIKSATYKNGDLWPVHLASVASIKDLYIHNERVVIEMASELGAVAVILVGATNVGSMSLAFDRNLRTNKNMSSKKFAYPMPIEIQKGEELGTFHMGSTVIVLYGKEFRQTYGEQINWTQKVKVGEPLTPKI